MRRRTILGLSALSAITVAIGPAIPAGAVVVPPGSVKVQVCNALPAGLGGVLDSLAANVNGLVLLNSGLTSTTNNLTARTTDLVAALVAHIQTVDGGGNVAATAAVVDARVQAYADAGAAWTKAWKAIDTAELQGQVLGLQQSVLEDIRDALCDVYQES